MKIISTFHDYYDSIQGYGFDPTVIYLRKTKEIENHYRQKTYKIQLRGLYNNKYDYEIRYSGVVFFCAKVYPFVCFRHSVNCKLRYFYNPVVLLRYIERAYSKDINSHRRWKFSGGNHKKNIKEFFAIPNNFEVNIKLHEKFDSPVFVIHYNYFLCNNYTIVNPVLKDMNFQTVYDPYSAFQEIDMFLSGVMQSAENKMITISDKVRKQKHGFDKTSFRPKMKSS